MPLLDFTLSVETLDHQIIVQTPDDKSRFGNGSFFGDIKDLKLRRASLIGKGHTFTIDMVDGHAVVDGTVVYPPKAPPIGQPLKLIYYSEVKQRVQATAKSVKGFKDVVSYIFTGENKTLPPVRRYYIGWECMYKGKKCKWEMGVN